MTFREAMHLDVFSTSAIPGFSQGQSRNVSSSCVRRSDFQMERALELASSVILEISFPIPREIDFA
jgi:hypothetical protein